MTNPQAERLRVLIDRANYARWQQLRTDCRSGLAERGGGTG
jgi:hypothetical protein